MATVSRTEVQKVIMDVTAEIKHEIKKRGLPEKMFGSVPAVYVGRVSDNEYHIGWNYQTADKQPGDIAVMPHSDSYIENPHIHNILIDGLWHMLHFA